MPLSSHTARVPDGGGALVMSRPEGGMGQREPVPSGPWTLRLQTECLGSIQQVRVTLGATTAAERPRRR